MSNQKIPHHNSKKRLPERPAIDLDTFEQLRLMLGRDTPQMMAGLIENYLESAPRLLKKLRQAAEETKEELPYAARALKSCSLTFGAIRLCALCEELEEAPADVRPKVAQIEAEYERVRIILEAEWRRLYELRLKTDVFFPTRSCRNIGFYTYSSREQ
jgi:HPt (histidine-containing phosphotransfer) domain-containing protein